MDLPTNYTKLTPVERGQVREQYVTLQQGLCYHCKEPLMSKSKKAEGYKIKTHLFPENFFKWPVHLHHNHNTGMTIGAVHARCNAVLWQYFGE
jgi:hypothetical protein